MMSYLTGITTNSLGQYDSIHSNSSSSSSSSMTAVLSAESYDYNLPHTKTIDLIGEEFAPRKSPLVSDSSSACSSPLLVPSGATIAIPAGSAESAIATVVALQASAGMQHSSSSASASPLTLDQVIGSSCVDGSLTISASPKNGSATSIRSVNSSTLSNQSSCISLPMVSTTSPITYVVSEPSINSGSFSRNNLSITSIPATSQQLMTTSTMLPSTLCSTTSNNGTTLDLSSNVTLHSASEENGVLLCNLDELSRYIPENFYSEFNINENKIASEYLESNILASKTLIASSVLPSTLSEQLTTTLVSNQQLPILSSTSSPSITTAIPQSSAALLQGLSGVATLPLHPIPVATITQSQTLGTSFQIPVSPQMATATQTNQTPITYTLPTQPQPPQIVKNVTYVNPVVASKSYPHLTNNTTNQPIRLTTNGYAITPSGERITIQGLSDTDKLAQVMKSNNSTSVQLQGLSIDQNGRLFLQENVDGRVVLKDVSSLNCDNVTSLLEEIKPTDEISVNPTSLSVSPNIPQNMCYVQSPVSVSAAQQLKTLTTLKRVAVPQSMVTSGNKKPRGVIQILSGNTLPPGAIPIQINGLSSWPSNVVKSLPINLSTLSPSVVPVSLSSMDCLPSISIVEAKKTRVESPDEYEAESLIAKLNSNINNNNSNLVITAKGKSNNALGGSGSLNYNQATNSKPVGNNKTCSWVFENGETCGKTFSKSYNLVVHMRMHEDVRPFCCSHCDQTFRQKAHLQRHETTHGVGSKADNNSGILSCSGNSVTNGKRNNGKRRKMPQVNNIGSFNSVHSNTGELTTAQNNSNLQKRLAHVSETFGICSPKDVDSNNTIKLEPSLEAASSVQTTNDIFLAQAPSIKEFELKSNTQNELPATSSIDVLQVTLPTSPIPLEMHQLDINSRIKADLEQSVGMSNASSQSVINMGDHNLMLQSRIIAANDADTIMLNDDCKLSVNDGRYTTQEIIQHVMSRENAQDMIITSASNENNVEDIIIQPQASLISSMGDSLSQAVCEAVESDVGTCISINEIEIKDEPLEGLSHSSEEQLQQHLGGSSGVMTTTATTLDCNGAPVETIVIESLGDHSPEIQKEILNAILSNQSEGGIGALARTGGIITIQNADGSSSNIIIHRATIAPSDFEGYPNTINSAVSSTGII